MSDVVSEPQGAEPIDAGADEPAAPAEPSWAGPSQEEWQETQEALQYVASLLQPPQQTQPAEPPPVQLDPLDDGFQSQLDQYIEQKLGPYAEYVQAQQFREGEARAQDILADDIAKNGEFVFEGSKEQARQLANNLIVETNQQFPGDPRKAAEAALERAAQEIRQWEEAVGKAYHERQLNQLAHLGDAPRDVGASTNGAQQFSIPQGGSLVDVAYRHGGGR